MRRSTFLAFVAPSLVVMLALIFLPLLGSIWLSVHSSYVETHEVEQVTAIPLFGGISRTETRRVTLPVLDGQGNPVKVTRFVGLQNFADVVRGDRLWAALTAKRLAGTWLSGTYHDIVTIPFWGALEFTLLYVALTTPFILLLGLAVALAVDASARWVKGLLIFGSLLPFIITPVVGALSVYWLFLDNAIVNALLQSMGMPKFFFLSSALPIRSLIISYGVWSGAPFAFVVLYAGLQTVSPETLEAAGIDGASRWQRLRYVIIPHLMPLFVFVTLIHLMDAYRVFEPVLVFGSNLFANSMQFLTYKILNAEDNFNKAAAAALLTVLGILALLVPMLRHTWREHRGAAG